MIQRMRVLVKNSRKATGFVNDLYSNPLKSINGYSDIKKGFVLVDENDPSGVQILITGDSQGDFYPAKLWLKNGCDIEHFTEIVKIRTLTLNGQQEVSAYANSHSNFKFKKYYN
jgi:hypothetical protein